MKEFYNYGNNIIFTLIKTFLKNFSDKITTSQSCKIDLRTGKQRKKKTVKTDKKDIVSLFMPKGQSKTSNRDKDQVSVFEEEVLHLITLNTITLIIIFRTLGGQREEMGSDKITLKTEIWVRFG